MIVCVQVEAKGWCWVSYLITFHLNFFETGTAIEPESHQFGQACWHTKIDLSLTPRC